MKIDLNRKLTSYEIETIGNEIGCKTYNCNFTRYTGQLRQLRRILLNSLPKEDATSVATMDDTEVHDTFINNLYIPLRTMDSDEVIYLVPLDVLQQCEKLER